MLARGPDHDAHARVTQRGHDCPGVVDGLVAGADQALIARVRGLDRLAALPGLAMHQTGLHQRAAQPQLVAGGDGEA